MENCAVLLSFVVIADVCLLLIFFFPSHSPLLAPLSPYVSTYLVLCVPWLFDYCVVLFLINLDNTVRAPIWSLCVPFWLGYWQIWLSKNWRSPGDQAFCKKMKVCFAVFVVLDDLIFSKRAAFNENKPTNNGNLKTNSVFLVCKQRGTKQVKIRNLFTSAK